MKNDFENQNFDMFEEVAHNFGKSDSDISYEKMLSFTRCICGFMPNSNKKILTVSNMFYIASNGICHHAQSYSLIQSEFTFV